MRILPSMTARPDGRGPLRDERGASMVEMALALPVLLLFLFGIISYGILLSYKQQMTQVAAEAARLGAVAGSEAAAELAAQSSFTNNGDRILDRVCDVGDANDDGLSCAADVLTCTGPMGGKCLVVEVSFDNVSHPLVPPLPFISSVLPKTIKSTSSARIGGT
jgi:Flp pilus assembly protein TadG